MQKPGIVDEAIGWTESGLCVFHRRLEASKVGNVQVSEAMRHITQTIDCRRMARDQEKRMILAGKSLGQCPPDPVARAGNDHKGCHDAGWLSQGPCRDRIFYLLWAAAL